jgi:integrase
VSCVTGPKGSPARFHVIRHSVASAMLVDGAVSVRTASEVLGHATTAITADTYGHVAQQAKAHALGVVVDALSERSEETQ